MVNREEIVVVMFTDANVTTFFCVAIRWRLIFMIKYKESNHCIEEYDDTMLMIEGWQQIEL